MYYNKYLKYKIKYNQKVIDIIKISYNKINKILDNLDNYYHKIKYFKQFNNLIQYGGTINNYKKFIKNAKSIIIYYKNIAKEYYLINVKLNSQYINLVNILKKNKEIFDPSISLLQDNINNNIEFNLNIVFDENNINGGGWDMNTFQEKLTLVIDEMNENRSTLIQEKIKSIYEKLKPLDSFVEIITKLKTLSNNINLVIDNLENKKINPEELIEIIKNIISTIKTESPEKLFIILLNL